MRARVHSARLPVKLNLTPMIDVTFQLILFFLLAGHLAQQESSVELELPVARTGHKAMENSTRRIVINVAQDGTLILSGETIDLERLGRILSADRRTSETLEVRIRTDRRTPYGKIAPLLVRCAESGIWNVSFAVIGEEMSP
ncbi:MAG: biopolymer transporter ExbD [Thermogutta sp.]|uniref:ExbD/TolR family protein n=1 Tax=Thermogutta sp. TaxID=1962930 RepID=UPI0019C118C6|nr:biopolymer transporter ExbD [Thermogutta sp.]MBC7352163.1 biopolymer transporter ExbD [Thermogutta sp.]